jgi:hypothetical protein
MKTDLCQIQNLFLCKENITNTHNEMHFAEKLFPNLFLQCAVVVDNVQQNSRKRNNSEQGLEKRHNARLAYNGQYFI